MSIEETRAERSAVYGDYYSQAAVTQNIIDAMRASINWRDMAADQRDALCQIASKMARIVNGDPDYLDNWHDIQGYAQCVEFRLTKQNNRIIDDDT